MTLEIIRSNILGSAAHGFFTRKGGTSSGIYDGLNCGEGSSDQTTSVRLNRERVAEAMEVEATHLHSLHQHHSADVIAVSGPAASERPKADGMVSNTPGTALGVLTADCAPVLFSDKSAGVIGAAHSGWKGAIGGVLEATIAAMENLGADRANISAAIGPTISQRSYEVGPEFVERFIDEDPEFQRYFAGGAGDHAHFDLPGFVLHQLRQSGLNDVGWTGHCTYEDAGRFFSYRRATHKGEADYGRLISVIRL